MISHRTAISFIENAYPNLHALPKRGQIYQSEAVIYRQRERSFISVRLVSRWKVLPKARETQIRVMGSREQAFDLSTLRSLF